MWSNKKKLDRTSNYMAEPLKVLSDEGGRVFLNVYLTLSLRKLNV